MNTQQLTNREFEEYFAAELQENERKEALDNLFDAALDQLGLEYGRMYPVLMPAF